MTLVKRIPLFCLFFTIISSAHEIDSKKCNIGQHKIKSINQISYEAVLKNGNILKGNRINNCGQDKFIRFYERGHIMEESQYYFNSDSGFVLRLLNKYDMYVQLIERNRYECDGSIISRETNVYHDTLGQINERTERNWKSHVDNKFFFNYNSSGECYESINCQSEKCDTLRFFYDHLSNGNKIRKIGSEIEIYDEKGNLIEYKNQSGELWTKNVYKYNINNLKTEDVFIDGRDSTNNHKSVMKYDNAGHLINETHYNSLGAINYLRKIKWDFWGNNIDDKVYESGKLVKNERRSNKYTKEGVLIQENYLEPNGSISWKYINKYDSSGNAKQISSYYYSKLFYIYSYKYDLNGCLLEETILQQDKPKTSIKYENDDFGNWIKKIEFINAIPSLIIEREVEYF